MTERSSNFRPRREAPRETPENLIVGRNAVREALRAGRDMEKLLVSRGEATGSLREILALAREKGVVVQEVDRRRLDEMAENHQGVAALASMYAYSTLEEILALAREKGEPPCAGDVRPGRLHPHEGAHRLAQRLRGRGRDPGRDRAAKGLKPCCTLWTATT